ncbi:MAG: hypothetical protein U5R14_06570 [Gemmatimonadota bacterium]|nr:hypothetical protein [Gemmatimonadota bacterium]
MRRLLVVIMLVVFHTSVLEVGVGLARDGAVHHETTATAVSHTTHGQDQPGEHGHETGEPDGTEDQGPDHRHGTSTDHCTHVHGPGLPPAALAALGVIEVGSSVHTAVSTPSNYVPVLFTHPPRA